MVLPLATVLTPKFSAAYTLDDVLPTISQPYTVRAPVMVYTTPVPVLYTDTTGSALVDATHVAFANVTAAPPAVVMRVKSPNTEASATVISSLNNRNDSISGVAFIFTTASAVTLSPSMHHCGPLIAMMYLLVNIAYVVVLHCL